MHDVTKSILIAVTMVVATVLPVRAATTSVSDPYFDKEGNYWYTITTHNGLETYTGRTTTGLNEPFEWPETLIGDTITRDPGTNVGAYVTHINPQFIDIMNELNTNYDFTAETGKYYITQLPVTVTAPTLTKYVGDPDPALTGTVAKDKPTYEVGSSTYAGDDPVNYSLKRAPGEAVGVYPITVEVGDNPNYKVKTVVGQLRILADQRHIAGDNFTMYVGDPTPTVGDFKGTAIGKDGKPVSVTVDLSKADVTKVGTYDVMLRGADGQTKMVKLIVKDRPHGGVVTPTPGTSTGGKKDHGTPARAQVAGKQAKLPVTGERFSIIATVIGASGVIGGITVYLKRRR